MTKRILKITKNLKRTILQIRNSKKNKQLAIFISFKINCFQKNKKKQNKKVVVVNEISILKKLQKNH